MRMSEVTFDKLGGSDWTVYEARRMAAELAEIAATDDERNGAQLLTALGDHLDLLYGADRLAGDDGFDRLLPAEERSVVAEVIRRLRTEHPTGTEIGTDSPDEPTDSDADVDHVIRLQRPVNAAVSLAEGRALADRLAAAEGWQRNLGRALAAIYDYLDELYGGPGAFTELLTPSECSLVAGELRRAASSR